MFDYFILFCMWECFACVHLCVQFVCLVSVEDKTKTLDTLELEIGIIVSHHVGPENQT